MGKHKQVDTIVKCDEWLSTRTKKKIATTPSNIRRTSLSRPLKSIGNTLLSLGTSPPPPELTTHTKQSKLSNFFARKFQELKKSEEEPLESSKELPTLTSITSTTIENLGESQLPPFDHTQSEHHISETGDHEIVYNNENELPTLSRRYSPDFLRKKKCTMSKKGGGHQSPRSSYGTDNHNILSAELGHKHVYVKCSTNDSSLAEENILSFEPSHLTENINRLQKDQNRKTGLMLDSSNHFSKTRDISCSYLSDKSEPFNSSIHVPVKDHIINTDCDLELLSEMKPLYKDTHISASLVSDPDSMSVDSTIPTHLKYQPHSNLSLSDHNLSDEDVLRQHSNHNNELVSMESNFNICDKNLSRKHSKQYDELDSMESNLDICNKDILRKHSKHYDELDSMESNLDLMSEVKTPGKQYRIVTSTNLTLQESDLDVLGGIYTLNGHVRHMRQIPQILNTDDLDLMSEVTEKDRRAWNKNYGDLSLELSSMSNADLVFTNKQNIKNLISTQEANRELENFSLDSQTDSYM